MPNYLDIFKETGALLEGHFVLTSGRHSPSYFQCAKILQHPKYLSDFAKKISNHFENDDIDTVISPAVGGIVIGTEVGLEPTPNNIMIRLGILEHWLNPWPFFI